MIRASKEKGARVTNDNEADAYWLKQIGEDYYNLELSEWHKLEEHQRDLHARLDLPRKEFLR
jgi:hypothetical protein